jgi:hypothetical protein
MIDCCDITEVVISSAAVRKTTVNMYGVMQVLCYNVLPSVISFWNRFLNHDMDLFFTVDTHNLD